MIFSVITIFPELFELFKKNGIIGRAIANRIIELCLYNIRDFAKGRHKITDDRPYGGGCGMVMKPEPLLVAIREAKEKNSLAKIILLSPQGKSLNQNIANELALEKGLILVCGRYEGIDERICANFIDDEISIGDFVLTGGEIPAMVIIDAVTRLLPDSLGGEDSAQKDSFMDNLIEHAHYTRPSCFEEENVPKVLLSGNHKAIEEWRLENSLMRTFIRRPDLFSNKNFSKNEANILKKWCADIEKFITNV